MPSLKLAVQDAFVAALNVSAATSLAPVRQHVTEKTQPPLFIIGEISIVPIGGKDGGLDQVTVTVLAMTREPSRRTLYQMQDVARSLIEGQQLTAAGFLFSRPIHESSEDELLEDGQTYLGTQRFSTIVQPA